MSIVLPIASLAPDPNNPRRMKDNARAGLGVSMETFGPLDIVFNTRTGQLVSGHQRIAELKATGATELVREGDWGYVSHPKTGERFPVRFVDWDETKQRLANLASNNPEVQGEFTEEAIEQLRALEEQAEFEALQLDELLKRLTEDESANDQAQAGNCDPDDVPEPPAEPVSKRGDVWLLGEHRLMCGDSTSASDVARLMDGATLVLIHADPPYGMGKESDGVANDNLYDEDLDRFQMAWWRTWAAVTAANGSAYIWGNAPGLWRLWWNGGLCKEPKLLVRNEIVWDKGSACGMTWDGAHSYPPATERCLFLMRGEQFLGNQNADAYWEGYEPLRAWLEAERAKAGLTNGDINRITGTQMAGHWFTKTQFQVISREHYHRLAAAAAGRGFVESYDELLGRVFPNAKAGGNKHRRGLARNLREARTFFDNSHDAMTDVWQFPRVVGDERYGHATPKPVAMVGRAMKSSSRPGDAVGAPFSGTGPELIAAEQLGRCCFAMELEPRYVDVAVARWERFTGEKAHRAAAA